MFHQDVLCNVTIFFYLCTQKESGCEAVKLDFKWFDRCYILNGINLSLQPPKSEQIIKYPTMIPTTNS